MGRPYKDLTRKKFGRLRVLHQSGRAKNGAVLWLCKCACGNTKRVIAGNLIHGGTKSCGCLNAESRRTNMRRNRIKEAWNKLPHGMGFLRGRYNGYAKNSKKKGLEFALSIEEFRDLIIGDCYYCGAGPKEMKYKNQNYNGYFAANGVDRKDNSLGYLADNCVPCCGVCNHAT